MAAERTDGGLDGRPGLQPGRALRLDLLTEASRTLNSALPQQEKLETLTRLARELIGAHQGVLSLTDEDGSAQSIWALSLSDKYAAWRGYDEKPEGSGIVSLICETGEAMRLTQEELEAHHRFEGFGTAAGEHPPLRGWLAAPLIGADGDVLGLIQLSDRYAGDFTEEDEELLVYLAHVAAAAIENQRMYDRARDADRLYALSRDLFCTLGFDGYFKSVNPAWQRALGYTQEELGSRPFLDFVHPEDRIHTGRALRRLTRAGEVTVSFEHRYLHRGGSYRWLLWSGHASEQEELIYGVAKDVTERKRAEERLRESERKYRDLVETSSDLIWSLDLEGRFTFVNRAARRIYGYEPEEMLGRSFSDFELPEQARKDVEVLGRLLSGRPLFGYPTQHVRKDGGLVDLSLNAIVLRGEHGQPIGATGTATDLTGRRRAEERQAAVAELGRQALEGVGLKELTQAAVSLVAEFLGVERSEVLELLPDGGRLKLHAGVGWSESEIGRLFPGAPSTSHAAYTLELDRPVVVEDHAREERFSQPDAWRERGVVSGACVTIEGQPRPFGVLCVHSSRPRSFGADEVSFLQAIANVLATAIGRKRSEEQIVELAAARGRLVAQTLAAEDRARRAISEVLHDHALQDLLASRQDLVEVSEDPGGDPDRVVRARAGIERAVQLLRDAVFNLHPVVLEHAGLASAIRAVSDHQARRGGFECEVTVEHEATGVHDELILSLARELVTNAAKHAQATRVTVSVRREGQRLVLEVADDGRGMDAGRRSAALREGHVGLASSAERVEALAGRFEVESAPGRGTTARAVLPARRSAAHRAGLLARQSAVSARPRAGDR